jgi:predicted AAA+ superfamily ATPase
MSSLLNKSHVKKFALAYAQANRGGRFERVSAQFIEEVEAELRLSIGKRIMTQPSKGKTLMGR